MIWWIIHWMWDNHLSYTLKLSMMYQLEPSIQWNLNGKLAVVILKNIKFVYVCVYAHMHLYRCVFKEKMLPCIECALGSFLFFKKQIKCFLMLLHFPIPIGRNACIGFYQFFVCCYVLAWRKVELVSVICSVQCSVIFIFLLFFSISDWWLVLQLQAKSSLR